MSIKVTVEDNATPKEKPFPKVMVSESGNVILFYNKDCGTVLGGEIYTVGIYGEDWDMSTFKDFTGTITMECN